LVIGEKKDLFKDKIQDFSIEKEKSRDRWRRVGRLSAWSDHFLHQPGRW